MSHQAIYNQKRTCERIGKSGSGDKEMTAKRLKRYGYVDRRESGNELRRMVDAPVPGKRRETMWTDSCRPKRDMENVWLTVYDVLEMANWKTKLNETFRHPR